MNTHPVIHKYHFGDMREQIFAKLETIFQNNRILSSLEPYGYKYICTVLTIDKKQVKAAIILVDDNVLIQNSFPDQPNKHERLWMIGSFFGQITYVEVENTDLRNVNKFDRNDPSGNTYEMHAMPNDLKFLDTQLNQVLALAKSGKLRKDNSLDISLINFLPTS